MNWKEADLEAFHARRAQWERHGAVRTHRIADEPEGAQTKPAQKKRLRRVNPTITVKLNERQVIRACMQILSKHPKVALAWRQNSGRAIAAGGQSIKFAFKGCSDLLGMLRGGRFLAVETKATGSKPSPEQLRFLQNVNEAGGLGLCVDDPSTLLNALETA